MLKLSLAIILLIMKVFPPFEQTLITYPKTIYVQYLRILFSSFGKENFQRSCKQQIKFLHFSIFQVLPKACRWSLTLILTNKDDGRFGII